jgi:5,5'-dehydrodivanillate O-demethylase oxygenase subunit
MVAMAERQEATNTGRDWTDFHHTGPDTLAGRFMRTFWHPVYAGEDLRAGRAVPLQIMNERLTLYRGETGTPHAVAFRCAHRGTQLSTGWVEADDIRCRYHGWKYGGNGQCVEQPCEPEPFCDKISVRSYPTEEYLGLIFIYMGEGEAPPLPRFAQFDASRGIIEVAKPKLSESNYFRRVEQISDEAHLMWAHRYEKPYSQHDNPEIEAHETDHGIVQIGKRPDGKARQTHYIMPNLMYVTNNAIDPAEERPRERLMWKVPVDDDHYLNLGVLMIFMQGEAAQRHIERQKEVEAARVQANTPAKLRAILAGQLTLEEVDDKADISHLEDEVVLAGMGRLEEGPLEEHLGRTDVGVVMKRKIWERELRALAEGRPMKQWRIADGLTVSEGI